MAVENSISLADAPAPVQTDEAIKRKRLLAEALMKEGMDYSPIRHPLQGAARLAQALVGGWEARQADQAEEANNSYNADLMKGLLTPEASTTGSVTPRASLTPTNPAAQGVADGGDMGRYRDAIAAIESRGSDDYGAIGPKTKTGDQAFGRYQVMGANVPSWTKEALGYALTPQQFLADKQAQDAVFDKRFGGYMAQGGPQNAASMWFTGKPLAQGANRADVNGVTGNAYVDKFNKALGSGPVQVASNDANGAFGMAGQPSSPAPAQNGHAQRLLAAMADPLLSAQNKQILMMMYKQAVGNDGSHRHVVNGALVDDSGNVLYKGETKPEPRTELQRDLEYAQQHPEAMQYFQKKYGGAAQKTIQSEVADRKATAEANGWDLNNPRIKDWVMSGTLTKDQQRSVTPTDKKMIDEADNAVAANKASIGTLQDAKRLSSQSWGSPGAGISSKIASSFPNPWQEGAQKTVQLDNMVTENALNQLKTTFGGNPTEGERAILLQIQGASSQPDKVRQAIYDRAIKLATRRMAFNQRKAHALRSGDYFSENFDPQSFEEEYRNEIIRQNQANPEWQTAKQLIASGKDRNAVIQKLIEHDIDPEGL